MSASDKKKIRKEQAAVVLTERQKKEQAELKKLKMYSAAFVAGLLIVFIAAFALLGKSLYTRYGITERFKTVAVVDDNKMSTVDFRYYFNDMIDEFYSTYTQYEQYGQSAADYILAIEGMDVSLPLNEQIKDKEAGTTWADYFVEEALIRAKSDFALNKLAEQEGFQLSEEDQSSLDNTIANIETYAQMLGYGKATNYLRALYGNGSNLRNFKEYTERRIIAEAYKTAHQESLSYDAAAIEEYSKDNSDNYNSYNYSYAYLSYTDFRHGGTEDESGTMTYTDAENEAAREAVKYAAETLATSTTLEELKEMIHMFESEESHEGHDHAEGEEATEGEEVAESEEATDAESAAEAETPAEEAKSEESAESTEDTSGIVKINSSSQLAVNDFTNSLHTEINAPLAKWLADSTRKEGDIAAIENTSTTKDAEGNEITVVNGYYVVCFKSKTDNREPLANVRHLLVQFEGGTENEETGEIEYSEEEKATTKAEADGYLKTWEEGARNEASFIDLVKAHSDDTGSVENGGLYEDIHPKSEYVANFLNWAIAPERKANDAAVIETEYGYHVMYYVSDDEVTYRDYMITSEMRVADQEAWYEATLASISAEIVDTSSLQLDLVISPAS